MNSSVSVRQNADLLEAKYAQWCENPQSVEATWAAFFEGFELGSAQLKRKEEAAKAATKAADTNYNVATATVAVTTNLIAQSITFGANPGPVTYAPSGNFTVSATGGGSAILPTPAIGGVGLTNNPALGLQTANH